MNSVIVMILRVLHVGAGVVWAGASIFMLGFLEPAVKATAPAGGRVMTYIGRERRFATVIAIAAGTSFLSGAILFVWLSGGFRTSWLLSGRGLTLSIGAIAGIIAFAVGSSQIAPTSKKILAISTELQGADGPPDPAKLAEMGALQEKNHNSTVITTTLLVIAIITMSAAEYMVF